MQPSLIDLYQAIEASSARMLQAAQAQDWDAVARCESTCAVLIAQLRLQAGHSTLEPAQRRQKTAIMRRILQNDAQIRALAEPWLAQFEHLFDGQPHVMH